MPAHRPTVLYVEDDEGDRFFVEHAFKCTGLPLALRTVPDGRAAVEYLSGSGPYANRAQHPVPCLVLLDLKLPQLSGFEVLEWIRKHPEYAALPVVILSASSLPEDISKAKASGATDFWQKPSNGLHYSKIVATLCDQWLAPSSCRA